MPPRTQTSNPITWWMIIVSVIVIILLLWKLPQIQTNYKIQNGYTLNDKLERENDARVTLVQIFGGIVLVSGAFVGWMNFKIAQDENRRIEENRIAVQEDRLQAEKWRRTEFLLKESRDFFNKPSIRNALWMLDWTNRKIPLFPEREGDHKYVVVTQDNLICALRIHSVETKFDEVDQVIRDTFDELLDSLERFDSFIERGHIDTEDLTALQYWLKLIANADPARGNNPVSAQLGKYIQYYGFDRVQKLCHRVGFTMRNDDASKETMDEGTPVYASRTEITPASVPLS